MGLRFPPALSIVRFNGSFRSSADFTDLADTDTNDAQNVDYTEGADLTQRAGSERLYNTKLTSTGGSTGRPITGHVFFRKLGANDSQVVAAGDSLFNYTSATASVIRSGLTDNSQTFWQAVQIQDPRSASDDIVLLTNGVDAIQLWNGSATAVILSSLTSATQVPIGKYITQLENRVYVANIVDATDVDSPVKVMRTGFGTDGAPDPHRFTEEFYIGGSTDEGELQGQEIIGDNIAYYTEKSIWLFSPGLGDVNDLRKVIKNTGLIAPRSLKSIGDIHVFLSHRGVMVFDGSNLRSLSGKMVNKTLFEDSNKSRLPFAVAEFKPDKNQYILYLAMSGSSRNDIALVYDFNLNVWQPPIKGRRVSYISHFKNSSDEEKIIYGDYSGYLYEDDRGINDGIFTGFNGTVVSSTPLTLTTDQSTFPTAGDGLGGVLVRIYDGDGEGQERVIVSNTSAVLTVESDWNSLPNSNSLFTVGGINSYFMTKDYDLGGGYILKIFKSLNLKLREEGDFSLDVYYIVDFKKLDVATLKQVLLLSGGMVWGTSLWGAANWGRAQTIQTRFSFRNTNSQRMNGNYIAFRFGNPRANQEWTLRGFDLEAKPIGKR